jgi:acetyltransferase-like isoleucine patch superfamily enzyme
MLMPLLRAALAAYTLRTNRLTGLYRRVCRPDGQAWAALLRRHGGLHAMGDDCVIQQNVAITDPAYVRLGNNVHLTGCTLFGHDGSVTMLKKTYRIPLDKVGKIDIGDNVFVGHQAIVMPGVTIGSNSIVAAGAVVTRNVPSGSIVAGIPAKVIGTTQDYVARLQQQTQALPWATHPAMHPDCAAPATPELDDLRVAYFFGSLNGEFVR